MTDANIDSGNRPPDLVPLHVDISGNPISRLSRYFKNIKNYSYLLRQLIIVDITNSYKRSFIGMSWLVINPFIAVFVWVLLNGAGIINPGETSIPYPAYVLLSTSIWSFFHGSYMITSNVIFNGGRFMVTAKFPHEVLVAQQIGVHCFNFIIPFFINIIVLIIYGIKFTWLSALFPVTLIPLLLLGTGLGLLVALLRVVAVDFSNVIDQSMSFLMFLTPIVYAPKIKLDWLSDINKLNPLSYLIGFSRELLTKGEIVDPVHFFIFSAGSLLFFIICLGVFMKFESKLLERLINV